MGPNQETQDYISVSIPKIIFDGEYGIKQFFLSFVTLKKSVISVYCSTIVCPKNTFKCVVTSEASSEDKNNMNTIAECLDENENILDKKE